MATDVLIRDYKQQYDINRETAKTLAISSREIDQYEYLRDWKILPSNQSEIIEHAKFTYSPLGEVFEKQKQNDWRSMRKTNWSFKTFNHRKK